MHPLSAEVQRTLQHVVGSPEQLSIVDLRSLSVVLSNFQEEVNTAILQKSKYGDISKFPTQRLGIDRVLLILPF